MYGFVTVEQGPVKRQERIQTKELCGLPVLHGRISLPEGLSERRAERRVYQMGKKLWEQGVSHVLTASGFFRWSALLRSGLVPVKTAPLCRAAAVPLALAVLPRLTNEPERAVICLAGTWVSPELLRASEQLALQVSQIVVDAGAGSEKLAFYLHEEYGLPVLHAGAITPTLTISFEPGREHPEPELVLWQEPPILLGAQICFPGIEPPPDCDALSLLAALREYGRISDAAIQAWLPCDFAATSLDIFKERSYNIESIMGH